MTEQELYNEYRKNNCKSFTDFLINKITELKKEVLEVRQHLDLTEKEWGKDLDKQIHFKTLCTKLEEENAELKKANEWHYVKDGLPPIKKEYNGRSELVLVLSKEKEMQYAQYVEKEKTWARGICEINFKPYAWKEIVLPKEIE